MRLFFSVLAFGSLSLTTACLADDWPQWMGPRRDDVWREHGILQSFPTNGPAVLWRVSVEGGYSGPAVVGNRLFVMDRPGSTADTHHPSARESKPLKEERVLCLDARSGKEVWERTYPRAYEIGYPGGPRTTPTVSHGKVFTLGAMGDLLCLRQENGEVLWKHNLREEYNAKPPVWGWAAHPLLDGKRLICLVGGSNSAVVAFQADNGKELWRALNAVEIGYAPPVIYTIHGKRQLIIWHPDAVSGLDPETGKVFWSHAYPVGGQPQRPEVTIALPRLEGDRLFLTCFYQGSLLLKLGSDAQVVWNRRSSSGEVMDDGLHTVLGTPIFKEGYIYGVCGFGELRCLDAATGDRRWETYAATGGHKGFFANAFLTSQGDRTFLYNDQGELIIARLKPDGYEEISRAKLLDPLEKTRGRTVTWCHPAYANRCAYVHNGKELICVSLAG